MQELWLTEQTVDVNAQSMCCQSDIKPGSQTSEGMSVIDLDLKQLRKLMIDGFDHLANAIENPALFWGKLGFLIRAFS